MSNINTQTLDGENVTCTLGLSPATGQTGIGGTMVVYGTVNQGSRAVPNAKVNLSLTGDATFIDEQKSIIVQANEEGRLPSTGFSANVVCDGYVRATPTDPTGTPTSMQYTFVSSTGLPLLSLDASPKVAPADGISPIVATATLMLNLSPVPFQAVNFQLIGSPKAIITANKQSSAVVLTDQTGVATVSITDKIAEEVYLLVSCLDPYTATPAQTTQFNFSDAPKNTLTLKATSSTFSAAVDSVMVSIFYADKNGNPLQGPITMQIIGYDNAYFSTYNARTVVIETNEQGEGSIGVTAATWGNGQIDASDNPTDNTPKVLAEPLLFSGICPPGLSVTVDLIAYGLNGGDSDFVSPTQANGQPCNGGPASQKGTVQVSASYRLNGKPWNGFGPITFTVPASSKAKLFDPKPAASNPNLGVNSIDIEYNKLDVGELYPTTNKPALVWIRDGKIESVTLQAIPGAGAKGAAAGNANVTFGPAWCQISDAYITFSGAPGASGYIYQNGLNQAAIRIDLTLADASGDLLTDDNRPAFADIQNVLTLVDYNSSLPYTTKPGGIRNSFSFVEVQTVANFFDKQMTQAGAAMVLRQEYDDDGPTFSNGVVTLNYYLVFSSGLAGGMKSTMVGLKVKPPYSYGQATPLNYVANGNGPGTQKTISILAKDPIQYALRDFNCTVTLNKEGAQNDSGLSVASGFDAEINYKRRWDVEISLRGSSYQKALFGAFLGEHALMCTLTGSNYVRKTSDSILYDVKTNLYQTQLYFWQGNNYVLSDDDYKYENFLNGIPVIAPGQQSMVLDGLTPISVTPSNSSSSITLTVIAGFGDFNKSAGLIKELELKLVDVCGNYFECGINLALPGPETLLTGMQNWSPLAAAAVGGGVSPVTETGVQFYRYTPLDGDNKNWGETGLLLDLYDDHKGGEADFGGNPSNFSGTGINWAVAAVNTGNTSKNSNELLYRVSGTMNSAKRYLATFQAENSSPGHYMVAGNANATLNDFIQVVPCWSRGLALVFAASDVAKGTAGTYWAWSGLDKPMRTGKVAVFGIPYTRPVGGAAQVPVGLWFISVEGQSLSSGTPSQPGNQTRGNTSGD